MPCASFYIAQCQPATAQACGYVCRHSWWTAQPMSRARRCPRGSSSKQLAVPPSICPHIPQPFLCRTEGCTFTNSPGGPGSPMGPSGPGEPGSPRGPRGPGIPGEPGLPWRTKVLHQLRLWCGLGVLAETPSHPYSHTYRHTWLPFLAW